MDLLQWPGMALSLLGAYFITNPDVRWRRRGFACWLVANPLLILWAIWHGAWGIALMQVAFLITSGIGWWRCRVSEGPQAYPH